MIKDNKGRGKEKEYRAFVEWVALPRELRQPPNQKLLSKHLNVPERTLSVWKSQSRFKKDVKEAIYKWTRDKTPDVLNSLYKTAVRHGNAKEVKLWLEFVENWAESQRVEVDKPILIKSEKKA